MLVTSNTANDQFCASRPNNIKNKNACILKNFDNCYNRPT